MVYVFPQRHLTHVHVVQLVKESDMAKSHVPHVVTVHAEGYRSNQSSVQSVDQH